jgi:hypothetical protein
LIAATWKRIFVKCDLQYKNSHTFSDGNIISIRRTDNFDRRHTQPVNAIVIDAERIPKGAEVLLNHNATHATYEIFDYTGIAGTFISGTERYFSIPETECYAWRINEKWNPCEGFELGLRIFKPYNGFLESIFPMQIKNKLLITSGEFKNKVVVTKSNSDYEIIYQEKNGREAKLIRIRHFNEPENIREEIVAIDFTATEKVLNGEYLLGHTPQDAKPINVLV